MTPFPWRQAWRSLRGGKGRLAMTVVALAAGVALVAAMDLANRAVQEGFNQVVDTMAGRVALEVNAPSNGLIDERLVERIAAVDGVEFASPVVTATTFPADESGELLTVLGVDLANEASIRAYATTTSGAEANLDDPLVFLGQPDSIAVPKRLADRRGLRLGSPFVLDTPVGRRSFIVRTVLLDEGVGQVFGGSLVVMDVLAAEAIFTSPGFVTRIDIVVPTSRSLPSIRTALEQVLPAGLQVDAPAQRKADLHAAIRSMHVLLDCVAAMSLFAGMLISMGRVSAVFERREWQFGVQSALGMRRFAVWHQMMAETAVMATAGVAVGLPAGIVLGHLLVPVVAQTTAVNFRLVVPAAALSVRPASLLLAAVLGYVSAFCAAAAPAWRVARRPATETIRTRGTTAAPEDGRTTHWPAVLLLVAIVAGVAAQAITRQPAFGIVTTILLVSMVALSARPLVRASTVRVLPRLADVVGPMPRFAGANLAISARRTGFMTAAVGIGVGCTLWLSTMALSFERSLVDALSSVVTADFIVGSAHIVGGRDPTPIDDAVLGELRVIPGVERVLSWRIRDWEFAGGPIALHAFDREYYAAGDMGRWTLVGSHEPNAWQRVASGTGAVVSTNFCTNTGARVGDTITLDTPGGPLALELVGTTVAFTSPRGTLFLSREVYRRLWNDPQITQGFVRLTPAAVRDDVRARIAAKLGTKYRLGILTAADLLAYWVDQVRHGFAAVPILAALVLSVVLLGLADALAAEVVERTRDIGALRALGARRAHVRRLVVSEALLTGTIGLVLAVALGLSLGVLWVEGTFPLLLGWALDFHVPVFELAVVMVITVAICAAAAVLPAIRAARITPVEALRYE